MCVARQTPMIVNECKSDLETFYVCVVTIRNGSFVVWYGKLNCVKVQMAITGFFCSKNESHHIRFVTRKEMQYIVNLSKFLQRKFETQPRCDWLLCLLHWSNFDWRHYTKFGLADGHCWEVLCCFQLHSFSERHDRVGKSEPESTLDQVSVGVGQLIVPKHCFDKTK